MADYRLKIKIGEHEFDAEGPEDKVHAQFEMFKEIISNLPAPVKTPAQRPPADPPEGAGGGGSADNGGRQNGAQLELDKIMKVDARVVSLTVRAASSEDAILLILLGQRQYRSNDTVTGGEIADGLNVSGQPVARPDRILDKLSADDKGLVMTVGQRKGRRYRLTNVGVTKAQEIARNLIALVP
jgi:hypothetical protein